MFHLSYELACCIVTPLYVIITFYARQCSVGG